VRKASNLTKLQRIQRAVDAKLAAVAVAAHHDATGVCIDTT
jgi:hypothetical protein